MWLEGLEEVENQRQDEEIPFSLRFPMSPGDAIVCLCATHTLCLSSFRFEVWFLDALNSALPLCHIMLCGNRKGKKRLKFSEKLIVGCLSARHSELNRIAECEPQDRIC